jgi:hypothetical protein
MPLIITGGRILSIRPPAVALREMTRFLHHRTLMAGKVAAIFNSYSAAISFFMLARGREVPMAALAHYGFGFAAKRIVPKVPVGFLLLACGALDPTITNRMPIFFQAEPSVGLGLYRTVFGVIFGEGVFFLAGVALYVTWLVKYKREKKAKAAGLEAGKTAP